MGLYNTLIYQDIITPKRLQSTPALSTVNAYGCEKHNKRLAQVRCTATEF